MVEPHSRVEPATLSCSLLHSSVEQAHRRCLAPIRVIVNRRKGGLSVGGAGVSIRVLDWMELSFDRLEPTLEGLNERRHISVKQIRKIDDPGSQRTHLSVKWIHFCSFGDCVPFGQMN